MLKILNIVINMQVFFFPDNKNNSKNGWQGRLCWDIPFICSYNNLNIYRKNDYLFLIK